jgi:membrane protein YqaA with SNARE-associated domain
MDGTVICVAAGYFMLAVVSAVLPWVNGEVLMISAIPIAASRPALAALVVAVSAGQMTGKSVMYWLARLSTGRRPGRWRGVAESWRARLQDRPRSALATTFISSLVGFPPFFVVSIVAGSLGMAFGRFLAVGATGRLIHFAIVAFVPEFLWRAS